MMKTSQTKHSLSRRDFLKLSGIGLGALVLRPFSRYTSLPEFPAAEYLGRNCTGGIVKIRAVPDVNSQVVREIYEDTVLPWLREVPASQPDLYHPKNQRWVETPEGYIYSPLLQPVRNLLNQPLTQLPTERANGFWAEITVPYVNLEVEGNSTWADRLIADNYVPRFYYHQIVWIDQVQVGTDGQIRYRINERYGNPGEKYWGPGEAFRMLTDDEVAPISPEVDPNEKTIQVNITNQTLACYEGEREVYFCRVSTGALFNASGQRVDIWETPIGEHSTHHKYVSMRMAAGTMESGYEEPCVGWVTFIVGSGVAIHSVHWHNDFGTPRSHGCINCLPNDAKWIFRWTTPECSLAQGEVGWTDWQSGSTHVHVFERYY
jgi:lipoprotein-anchoring transpeptidase ErfK/SrfK